MKLVSVLFAEAGAEFQHKLALFRHVFEGAAVPGNVQNIADIFGAKPDFVMLIDSGANVKVGKLKGVGEGF